ncbi:hypothetical protein FB451DRAFT_1252286 [Mycena latifolia]|nr:hypothetical protein FB451DRAFT_1252286 [Mycena latifolia]
MATVSVAPVMVALMPTSAVASATYNSSRTIPGAGKLDLITGNNGYIEPITIQSVSRSRRHLCLPKTPLMGRPSTAEM